MIHFARSTPDFLRLERGLPLSVVSSALFKTESNDVNEENAVAGGTFADGITLIADPQDDEMAVVRDGLRMHNLAKTSGKFDFPGTEDPGLAFDLAITGPDGVVVGGLNVSSILGVMWLEVLWVAEVHRGRGLASWLVLEAERIAADAGCIGAGTWTFDWQGADFYPRIGYELRGIYDGYPRGMTEHVLAKRLPTPKEIRDAVSRRVRRNLSEGYRLVKEPTKDEMRIAHRGLHEHCVAHVGDGASYAGRPIRLVLRDTTGDVVGGLTASTPVCVLAFEELWVDEPHRGRGLGRRLVAEAERIAIEQGCGAGQSSCLSFQAPGFFRRVGYETFGTVDVYMDEIAEELLIRRFPVG